VARVEERTYRRSVSPAGLITFRVAVKETDLLVSAERDASRETLAEILTQRRYIEERLSIQPEFLTSLEPLVPDPLAPGVVRDMLEAGLAAGVGPMAAVAGALAGRVGAALRGLSGEVIVENGGDLFLAAARDLQVAIHAGRSALSGRLGLRISREDQPLGVGTSSATVGHSLSLGRADAATVVAQTPALADALATALGNRVRTRRDLAPALDWLAERPGALGGLVVLAGEVAAWGRLEVIRL